jgi:colicin import membrane protein
MKAARGKVCLITSLVFHAIVFFALVVSFELSAPLAVIENTNKNDVISAVVLGDTAKSRILPQVDTRPDVPKPAPQPKPVPAQSKPESTPIKKDVIVLKKVTPPKKVIVNTDIFGKDLLKDIKSQTKQVKKVKNNKMQAQLEKMLHDQAELSLRQQLLNEDIKLKGTEAHMAQGVVNKYKALIVQAISEQWVVPTQINKKLKTELMIRLAPGGVVLDVQVTKSSGDPSLDSSARAAVFKASPLPVPKEADEFDAFRQFALTVKPENVE